MGRYSNRRQIRGFKRSRRDINRALEAKPKNKPSLRSYIPEPLVIAEGESRGLKREEPSLIDNHDLKKTAKEPLNDSMDKLFQEIKRNVDHKRVKSIQDLLSFPDLKNAKDEFINLKRPFTFQEFQAAIGGMNNTYDAKKILSNDQRFISLSEKSSEEKYFISSNSLYKWYFNLSIRLAYLGIFRLSNNQLARFFSTKRREGQWQQMPHRALALGGKYGFVAESWSPTICVFPLARVISFILQKLGGFEKGGRSENLNCQEIQDEAACRAYMKTPFKKKLSDALSNFNKKKIEFLIEREGLFGKSPQTLEQIGRKKGVTRERVRQVVAFGFWKKLEVRDNVKLFVPVFLNEIIQRKGCLLIDSPNQTLMFVAKCIGVPIADIPGTELSVIGADAIDEKFLMGHLKDWRESIDREALALKAEERDCLCLRKDDTALLLGRLTNYRLKKLTRVKKSYLALQSLGRPAHYSEIAEEYERLFPDDSAISTKNFEHNIHACLGYQKEGIVWIGAKGIYALKEWGYERPSGRLHDQAAAIVRKKYKETGKPVPFSVVVSEMGKMRKFVNDTSLTLAAHCNPSIQRIGNNLFVPSEASKDSANSKTDLDDLDIILREFKGAQKKEKRTV